MGLPPPPKTNGWDRALRVFAANRIFFRGVFWHMKIVAVPVLDEKDVAWAARRVIALYQKAPARIYLVNVQPAFSKHVSRFFSAHYLARIHREDATKLLAPVERALERA